MEEDIQNHSPTVMFRGTPCSIHEKKFTYSILEKQLYSSSYRKHGDIIHDIHTTDSLIRNSWHHLWETANNIHEKLLTSSMINSWHHPWETADITHEKQLSSFMRNSCNHPWKTAMTSSMIYIQQTSSMRNSWHIPRETVDIVHDIQLTSLI